MTTSTLNAPVSKHEKIIRDWFDARFKLKMRLRCGEVCGAMGNFGLSDRRDDLRKLVENERLTPLPKVNGEVKAHYHREDIIVFLVENCQPTKNSHD